eukprot:scaffold76062_cov36-Phaeocystis_antarctica.AAC.7
METIRPSISCILFSIVVAMDVGCGESWVFFGVPGERQPGRLEGFSTFSSLRPDTNQGAAR